MKGSGEYAGSGIGHDSSETHLDINGSNINLPDNSYIRDADIVRDGFDLRLEGPDGTIVINDYFAAEQTPDLIAPGGETLTPDLVQSFARTPAVYADAGSMSDASPVGGVLEVSGDAKVIRLDGSEDTIEIGTPIYQGDIIETTGNGAVNIGFIDETTFAVSEDAKLAIDEFVFDPSTAEGTTDFSVLKGVFVFTSGLIAREDPDDVNIETPVGSIGIRGTTIVADVDDGLVMVTEGAIVMRDPIGNEMTFTAQADGMFDVGRFMPGGGVEMAGQMSGADIGARFAGIAGVSPDVFTSIANGDGQNVSDGQPVSSDNTNSQESGESQNNAQSSADQNQDGEVDGSVDANGDGVADGTIDGNGDGGADGTVNSGTDNGENSDGAPAVQEGSPTNTDNGESIDDQSNNTNQPNATTTNTANAGISDGHVNAPVTNTITTTTNSGLTTSTLGTNTSGFSTTSSTSSGNKAISGTGTTSATNTAASGTTATSTSLQATKSGTSQTQTKTSVTTTTDQPLPPPTTSTSPTSPTSPTTPVNSEVAPTVNNQSFTTLESTAVGTSLGFVIASDSNAGDILSYSISGGADAGLFLINSATGEITLNATLDAETQLNYNFSITVSDDSDDLLSSTANITITAQDVNEFTPTISSGASVNIDENSANGITLMSVSATDGDVSGSVAYSIVGGTGSSAFTINATTGVITVLDSSQLNFEANPSFTLNIEASDGTNTAPQTITINLNDMNDAPILTASNPILTAIAEDTAAPAGENIGTLISGSITDADGDPDGIAITNVDDSNGSWEVSLDSGTTWDAISGLSDTNAFLVDNSALVRFVPNAHYHGNATFDFKAWDGTSGNPGDYVDTNSGNAFSASTDTADITITSINDAPDLTISTPNIDTIAEDTIFAGDTVANLFGGQISDIDGDPDGIAIVLDDSANGTWEYSLDGSTWNVIAGTTAANGLLLDGGDFIRFTPNTNYVGTATIDFKAWDGTSGTRGTYVDTTAGNEFSANTDTADIVVTATNDAPTIDLDIDDNTYAGNGYHVNYTEGFATTAEVYIVDTADFTIDDPDSIITQITIDLVTNPDGGFEYLFLTGGDQTIGNINVTGTNTTTITLTDAGGATNAEFESVVAMLTYRNESDAPDTGADREIVFTVDDGTNTSTASTFITVASTEDNDTVNGTAAGELIYGDTGFDTINGGGGDDTIYGGMGDDTFIVEDGDGDDDIYGEAGSDIYDATAAAGDFTVNLSNTSGNFTAFDGTNTDTVYQVENISTGSGDDTFIFASGSEGFGHNINAGAGIDTLDYSAYGNDTDINLTTGISIISGGAVDNFSSIENVNGSFGNDIITGTYSNVSNIMHGNQGADIFRVQGQYDFVSGDSIAVQIHGGNGAGDIDTIEFQYAGTFNIDPDGSEDIFTEIEVYDFQANAGGNNITFNLSDDMINNNEIIGGDQLLTIKINGSDNLTLDFANLTSDYILIGGDNDMGSAGFVEFSEVGGGDGVIRVEYTAGAGTLTLNNFGSASFISLNAIVAGLDNDNGFAIDDPQGNSNYRFGYSFTSIGDYNNDGYDDFIASQGNDTNSGDAFRFIGSATGATIDTSYASAFSSSPVAVNVSSAGDFDGDGINDLILGGPNINGNAGEVSIYLSASTQYLDLVGFAGSDMAGISVSGIGDFNGDGYDDVIVGVPGADRSNPDAGEAYILFGSDYTAPMTLDINNNLGSVVYDTSTVGATPIDLQATTNSGYVMALRGAATATVEILNYNDVSETFTNIASLDNAAVNAHTGGGITNAFDYTNYISMTHDETYTYVVSDGGIVTRIDISSGTISAVANHNGSLAGARDIVVDGPNAYFLVGTNVLQITDINSTISAPSVTSFTLPVGVHTIFAESGNIYAIYDGAGGTDSGIVRLANPITAATFDVITPTNQLEGALDVAVNGIYAYILVDVGGDVAVRIVNLSTNAIVGNIPANALNGITAATASIDIRNDDMVISGNNGTSGAVYQFDIGSGNEINPDLTDHARNPAFNFTSEVVLVGAGVDSTAIIQTNGQVRALDLEQEGIEIQGLASNDGLGRNVSSAGDINGDGLGDIIISEPGQDRVHIALGSRGASNIVLGSGTVQIDGISVDAADNEIPVFYGGDINGDGLSDIMLASTDGYGALHIFSGALLEANIGNSLNAFSDSELNIIGDSSWSLVGAGSIGDFNADGFSDLAVVYQNTADLNEINIFVVNGQDFGALPAAWSDGVIDHGELLGDPSLGTLIKYTIPTGQDPNDFGFHIYQAGDLNGDGFHDFGIALPDLDGGTGGGLDDADGSVAFVYGQDDGTGNVVRDGDVNDNDGSPNGDVEASADGQNLVGNETMNYLNQGAQNNIGFSAGGGTDYININTQNFNFIDGGAQYDRLQFFGSSIDFSNFTSEDISRVEEFDMMTSGQTMTLTVENIFGFMGTSDDNGRFTISSSGGGGNILQLDDLGGASVTDANVNDIAHLLGMDPADVSNNGTEYLFDIGGKTLAIEMSLVDGGNVDII